ncbi:hypothetical protein [Blastococcus xanthinilyticus]|uniref:Uncharacterized protein n=1 Tax=Blastococcus xanthinilyticus TaxID=1564164 RepID=A0A5S5CUI7_9ACTN|nr:hypothetical protein [Blastococcus xanthinilyticus]TYP87471.1 hypothetical protein BD833_10659 [Blastococcus xanthinilyticus]
MSTGPFLYDDDPAPLHTGAPRRSGKLMVLILAGTVLAAVLFAVLLPVVKGSPGEQATEVTGVFFAALAAGDTETAHQLLCEDEREQVAEEEMVELFLRPGEPEVTGVTDDETAGARVQQVTVRWDDGQTDRFAVINEDGPRVCGRV